MAEEKSGTGLDYGKLGFKAGLEIHQQLDTKKLFCNCPSVLRKDEPDYIVRRRLHAVAGEQGKVDIAAQYEAEKGKVFVYQGYNDTTCLVELDEEPPHLINEEALKIALQISLLLNAKIIPITQVMRKTVIDGSNTSGFQRTVMIARHGFIDTSGGKVGIEGIYLEEDAARLVSREKNEVVFRLDRLGIPLVEISTDASIKNPEQVKEAALKIGQILRSCKVKRGIGTIRQDLNMSIKESHGVRVEIKGFQESRIMVKTLDKEIKRQLELLKKGKKIREEVRNALPSGETEYLRPIPGAARMYPETDLPLLKISRNIINEVKKSLPKLKGDIEKELTGKGLNQEMIKLLFKQNKVEEFREFLKILNDPKMITKILLIFTKEIAKHQNISLDKANKILNKDVLEEVIVALKNKKISANQVKDVLERIVKGEPFDKAIKFEKGDITEIEEKIMKIVKSRPGLSLNAYMGIVMKNPEFRGKISGKEVMEIIKKHYNKRL